MGTAASVGGCDKLEPFSIPEILSKDEVKLLAGDKYQENVFLEIATSTSTITRRQFEHCVALSKHNLLKYVVLSYNSDQCQSIYRVSAKDWTKRVTLARKAGNLLEAAVAAHCAFNVRPSAARCLDWLHALHAHGTSPGRLVNMAQGWCQIYPKNEEIATFLQMMKKKVPHPFEEIEDQLYILTEAERQGIDDAFDAMKTDVKVSILHGCFRRFAAELHTHINLNTI